MKRIQDRLSLLIPFAFLASIDGGVTLFFQQNGYWTDHSKYLESNPFFEYFLLIGPMAFVGILVVWIMVLSGIILWTPRLLALGIGTGFIYGHSVGALGWLRHFCFKAHWNNIPYHMFIAFLLILAISDQTERLLKERSSQRAAAADAKTRR